MPSGKYNKTSDSRRVRRTLANPVGFITGEEVHSFLERKAACHINYIEKTPSETLKMNQKLVEATTVTPEYESEPEPTMTEEVQPLPERRHTV